MKAEQHNANLGRGHHLANLDFMAACIWYYYHVDLAGWQRGICPRCLEKETGQVILSGQRLEDL